MLLRAPVIGSNFHLLLNNRLLLLNFRRSVLRRTASSEHFLLFFLMQRRFCWCRRGYFLLSFFFHLCIFSINQFLRLFNNLFLRPRPNILGNSLPSLGGTRWPPCDTLSQ